MDVGAKRPRVEAPGASPTPTQLRRGNSDLAVGAPAGVSSTDAFMLKFQNEALSTKINDQKREMAEMQTKLDIMAASSHATESELQYLRQHWSQLDIELQAIAPRLGAVVPPLDSENCPRFTPVLWFDEAQGSEQQYDEALYGMSTFTKQIVDGLVVGLEVIAGQNADILQRLQAGGDMDTAAVDQIAALTVRCEEMSQGLQRMQEDYREITKKHADAASALSASQKRCARAEKECESLSETLRATERRTEKLEKEKDALKLGAAAGSTTPTGAGPQQLARVSSLPPSLPTGMPGLPPKKMKDFSSAGSDDVLQSELLEVQAVAESRLEELEAVRAENRQLRMEVATLESEGVADDKVKAHPAFQSIEFVVKEQHRELTNLYNILDRVSFDLDHNERVKGAEVERVREEYFEKIRAVEETREEALEKLARTRTERDDLERRLRQGDLNKQMATPREVSALLETNRARTSSELADKVKKIHLLETHRLELEHKLRETTARLSDVQGRCTGLETNISELQGVISMLHRPDGMNAELEATYNRTLADLKHTQSTLAGVKKEFADVRLRHQSTLAQLTEQKQENEALLAEIEAMSRSCEETEEQNARLVALMAEKEDSYSNLMQEWLKGKKRLGEGDTVTDALKAKAAAQDAVIAEQKAALATLEKNSRVIREQTAKYAEAERALQGQRHELIRQVQGGAEHVQRLEMTVQAQVQQLKDYKKRLEDAAIALDDQQKIVRHLEEENGTLKRKLEKGAGKTDITTSILEDEVRELKKMVKCTVCLERNKSICITKCFHVFCKQCIDANLSTRHRKCPACGEKFGAADTRPLFLV